MKKKCYLKEDNSGLLRRDFFSNHEIDVYGDYNLLKKGKQINAT